MFFEAALGIWTLFSPPLTQPELSIFACFVPISFKLLDYNQSWMNYVKDVPMQEYQVALKRRKLIFF